MRKAYQYDTYPLPGFGLASPLRQQAEDAIDAIPRRQRPRLTEWLRSAITEKLERDQEKKEGGK